MTDELIRLYQSVSLENTRLLVKGLERLHQGYELELKAKNDQSEYSWRLSELQKFIEKVHSNSKDGEHFLYQNPYTELFQFKKIYDLNEEASVRLSGMLLLYHQLQILEHTSVAQISNAYETLCNSVRTIQGADMCYLVFRRPTDTRVLCASSVTSECLATQLSSRDAEKILDRAIERKEGEQIFEGVYLEVGVESAEVKTSSETWRDVRFLILPILLYDVQGIPQNEQQAYLICQRNALSETKPQGETENEAKTEPSTEDETKNGAKAEAFAEGETENGLKTGSPAEGETRSETKSKIAWDENVSDTLLRVRDTLFLRGQLTRVLTRDLYNLLTAVHEYRDIDRKSSAEDPLKILHISDLHVTAQNCEAIKKAIGRLELDGGPVDFLVITGDVAQGRSSAGDLERNYDCAAEVIRSLAFHIWSENDGGKFLRQDWKRRTIIIPGNHDYASMNELETQHGESHRASAGGRPAAKEGSAMAKFTYYINFVRKLLDEDIGGLIDGDLNKLRRYDKMCVDFLCFNTSIMANPARNNKVHLDENFAQQVINRLSSEPQNRFRVFLGHHGPDYPVDYVSDEYLERYICRSITGKYVAAIRKQNGSAAVGSGHGSNAVLCQKELSKLQNSLDHLAPTGNKSIVSNAFIQVWLLENNERHLPDGIEDKIVRRRQKTRLYQDLTFLLEQFERDVTERNINERYQRIIADINRTDAMSRHDQDAYRKVFDQLNAELKLTVCLSGHTHEWGIDKKNSHYVASRFYEEKMEDIPGSDQLRRISSLHYGVCELSRDKNNQEIVNYQEYNKDVR